MPNDKPSWTAPGCGGLYKYIVEMYTAKPRPASCYDDPMLGKVHVYKPGSYICCCGERDNTPDPEQRRRPYRNYRR